jgi:uncharacterized protein (TIGR02598 family)
LITKRQSGGFSLVEVVIALGVFLFAGIGLISLLMAGIKGSRDSAEQIQAATIAEKICSTLRAAPDVNLTGGNSANPNFPIPPLNTTGSGVSGKVFLNADGAKVGSATDPDARFGLIYQIYNTLYPIPSGNSTAATPGVATLYICLYWPAQAPAEASQGHYELTTTFALQ